MADMNKDLDGQGVAKLIRFLMNPVTADPAAPVDGEMWLNETTNLLKARVNGVTQVVAFLSDLTAKGQYRGPWDASTGIPTAAGSTIDAGEPIVAGDWWLVSTGGTIAGIEGGSDVLEIGDRIFATADAAATAATFVGAQANFDATGLLFGETVTFGLAAGAATDVTPPTVLAGGVIDSVQILDGTGLDITSSLDVVIDQADPKITVTSLVALAGLTARFIGNPA